MKGNLPFTNAFDRRFWKVCVAISHVWSYDVFNRCLMIFKHQKLRIKNHRYGKNCCWLLIVDCWSSIFDCKSLRNSESQITGFTKIGFAITYWCKDIKEQGGNANRNSSDFRKLIQSPFYFSTSSTISFFTMWRITLL